MADIVTPNEVFQARWQSDEAEHLRYEYDLSESDLVIDVGAYRGEWANEIFRRYQCRIIAIEPTDSILGFTNGQIINKAAADYDGEMEFGGAFYYTSAFAEPNGTKHPCFDINKLLRAHEDIALMKVNIEGGEYSLLKRIISEGLHLRIRNLQIQFHQIEGKPYHDWYNEIACSLSKTHGLTWQYRFVWENWAQ